MTDAAGLVDAVAGWIERELAPGLSGRQLFEAKVAANALRIAQRELAAPPTADRAALAEAAREGTLDDADRAAIRADVLARIEVDSPGYPTLTEARALWPGDIPRLDP